MLCGNENIEHAQMWTREYEWERVRVNEMTKDIAIYRLIDNTVDNIIILKSSKSKNSEKSNSNPVNGKKFAENEKEI